MDSISTTDSLFIYGKLIIAEKDTLLTSSFEKGSLYPTLYVNHKKQTKGTLFFKFIHILNDTLLLDRADSLNIK